MQADKQPRTGAAVRVLRALKGMGRATKQQLAQATGLSVMAVGTAVDQLLAKGRILCHRRAPGRGIWLPCGVCACADSVRMGAAWPRQPAPAHGGPDGELCAQRHTPAGTCAAGRLCAGD